MRSFVTPHCHPQSLDTGSTIESLIKREKELGTGCITATDHGSMGACRKIYDLARKEKLTPILGLEAYFADPEDPILRKFGITDVSAYVGNYYHLTIHYLDQKAYEAGCRILSRADDRAIVLYGERKPPFTWQDLEELSNYNVTVGSGCFGGMVQHHIAKHQRPDIAIAYYERLRSLFKPENFLVEVFPHKLTHEWITGVFLTFADGTVEKYPYWKQIKIDDQETYKIQEFVKLCQKKTSPFGHLTAVMNNRKWEDCPPRLITKVERKEEFIPNECTAARPTGDLQWDCNQFVIEQANKYGDKLYISDDSHFSYPENKIVQDIRLSSNQTPWKFYGSYHRQSNQEVLEYFHEYMKLPVATVEKWIENSHEWAEKFKNFKMIDRKQLPTSFYPQDTLRHFYELIQKHGRMRWNNPEWMARLKSEVRLLHQNGTIDLLPYFFTFEEVCSFYEQNRKLTGPGRGSAAGLLSTYLLGITHVNPLAYELSQDRFLTLDRIKTGKLPDIDQDLPDTSILVDPETGYLKKRFGDCCVQISTSSALKLKSTVRDVARALYGSVPQDVEELAKNFEVPPQGINDLKFIEGYQKDDEWVEGSIERDLNLQKYIEKYPKDWEIVKQVIGLQRQLGRHASAYVLVNEPVSNFIPLTTVGGIKCTQYDMRSVEAVGGIKMDFLGLNSLNDISNAIELIQSRHGGIIQENKKIDGIEIPGFRLVPFNGNYYDIWELPTDDKVYESICTGKTETVFQLNTSGAKKWLRYFDEKRPDGRWLLHSVEDLAIFNALNRPGPLDYLVENRHNMLVEYTRRAKGESPIGNIPILDRMLADTHGVLIYQEQLVKVFQEIGETTGVQAQAFREHVGKKKPEEIVKDKDIFMPKAIEKLGLKVATELFKSLEVFGRYGFNCLDGTQKVLTSNGYVDMESVCSDFDNYEVAYLDTNTNKVAFETPSHAQFMGNKEVLEVELEDGTVIRATEDHRFLYEGEWIALKDIILKENIEVSIQCSDEEFVVGVE